MVFVLATPDYQLIHDALDYDHHAVSIAQGEGFATSYGRETAFRPPAFPIFLAGVYELVGVEDKAERVEAARLANALVGTGIVALIGLIAFQLWGRRTSHCRARARRDLRAADPRRAVRDVRAAVRALPARRDRRASCTRGPTRGCCWPGC